MPEEDLRGSASFAAGDALRAIAALMVLVYHAALVSDAQYDDSRFQTLFGPLPGQAFAAAGRGLYIFFVLSGYLIARPFVRALVAGTALPPLRRYARNRLLRIVPAFWVVFTVTLLVAGPAGRPLGDVLAVYGFAQSLHESPTSDLIVQGWTLGVELTFYALIPVAAALALPLLSRLPGPATRRVVIVLVTLIAAIATTKVPDPGTFHRTIVTLLWAFCPGVILAALEPAQPSALGRRWVELTAFAAPALLVFAVWLIFRPPAFVGGAAIGCGLFVAAPLLLQRVCGRRWRLVPWRPLSWTGERSYGIYLIHWGVLLLLRPLLQDDAHPWRSVLLLLAAAVPATVALAALSFSAVEQPFLRRRTPWRRPVAAGRA
jgi:peptidoglycan/LPS O-acetylase OafA/YrhL